MVCPIQFDLKESEIAAGALGILIGFNVCLYVAGAVCLCELKLGEWNFIWIDRISCGGGTGMILRALSECCCSSYW